MKPQLGQAFVSNSHDSHKCIGCFDIAYQTRLRWHEGHRMISTATIKIIKQNAEAISAIAAGSTPNKRPIGPCAHMPTPANTAANPQRRNFQICGPTRLVNLIGFILSIGYSLNLWP